MPDRPALSLSSLARRRLLRAAAVLLPIAGVLMANLSFGGSLTVSTTADVVNGTTTSIANLVANPGPDGISLREAIIAANNTAETNTITVPAGTYTLTAGELSVTRAVTINGAGSASTIISGNLASRIFNAGTIALTLTNMTLTQGRAASGNGGAILKSSGNLVMTSVVLNNNAAASGLGGAVYGTTGTYTWNTVTLSNNVALSGGGVYKTGGALRPTASTFTSNQATAGSGGAIWLSGTTSMIVNTSTLSGNTSTSHGAAIYASVSSASSMTGSTLSSNTSSGGLGGGAHLLGAGAWTLTNITVASNAAASGGGGLSIAGSGAVGLTRVTANNNSTSSGAGGGLLVAHASAVTTTATNVTLYANSASTGGGGATVTAGTLSLVNATVAGNTASASAGGLRRTAGTLRTLNTLVAANTGPGGNCAGGMTTAGYNLDSATTCGFTGTGDRQSAVAGLGTFGANGGTTNTVPILISSAAVNAGTATGAPTTDQRSYARLGSTDIGAFEYGGGSTGASISGTVFEDRHYGGGAGRNRATALADSGSGRVGAVVELYDSTGAFGRTTTTAADGSYSFTFLPAGTYTVRVVNGSVSSGRTGYVASLLPVQTFRTDAAGGSALAVTDRVGGQAPAKEDAGAGSTTLADLTTATTAAQSITTVALAAANITGVDFGYSFNVVVNTNDGGQGSLDQVVDNVNALSNSGLAINGRTAGIDHVIFMLPDGTARPGMNTSYTSAFSAGVASIAALQGLALSEALVIDAQTQPGWAANPIVEINGSGAGAGTVGITTSVGANTVRGLVINRFNGGGVRLSGGSNTVQGNWIGLASSGSTASANGGPGIEVQSGAGDVLGAVGTSLGNVLSGNTGAGILVQGSSTVIKGNRIGLAAASTSSLANGGGGVVLSAGTGTQVGGTATGEGNLIAGNTGNGVTVATASSANPIRGNSIYGNSSLGIDLDNDGVTANDGAKTSSTANLRMDKPVLTQAVVGSSTLSVVGYVGSAALQSTFGAALVDVYVSEGGSSSSGRTWVGTLTANADGEFAGTLSTASAGPLTAGSTLITATATDGGGNTSEFAANQATSALAALQNGGFETGPSPGSSSLLYSTGNTTGAPPWVVTGGSADVVGTYWQAAEGSRSLDLSGSARGGVAQVVQTVPGQVYALRFALAGNAGCGTASKQLRATAGSTTQSYSFSTAGSSNAAMGWRDELLSFTASAEATVLWFESLEASACGPALDNLRLAIGGTGSVAGTIFEDHNYGGGAGRARVASGGSGVVGTTLDLFDGSGNWLASTLSTTGGAYQFASLAAGAYTVRVRNSSVMSNRSGTVSGLWPVQTFRTDAASGSAVDVTDRVGGENPGLSDGGSASTLAGLDSSTTTAQSITTVTVSAAAISGVDFGFSFNLVVNTNDAGQGSLRQFITNANALADTGLAQSGRTAGIDNAVFMLPNGTAAAGLRAAYNAFSGGVATISPLTALPTISAPLVLDAQTQPGWTSNPLVEINGSGTAAGGLTANLYATARLTLRGFIVNRSPLVGVQLDNGASSVVQGNWIGLAGSGTAAAANAGDGLVVNASADVQIGGTTAAQRNVVSGNTLSGLRVTLTSPTAVITGNYIGVNASGNHTPAAVGNGGYGIEISSASNGAQVGGTSSGERNVIAGNANIGTYVTASTGVSIQGNLYGRDAADGATLSSPHTAIHIASSGATVGGTAAGAGNVITGAVSGGTAGRAGLGISGNVNGVSVLGNSIYGNGNGASTSTLGIDLGLDGATANDGAKTAGQPNLRMDTPVITSASLAGSTLTVAGYVGSAAGQTTFAGARVEVFVADPALTSVAQGKTYLGALTADGSGNFTGSLTLPGGVTLSVGSTRLTATATDADSNSSEFATGYLLGNILSGSVFEDLNYGGGAGRNKATALAGGGSVRPSARVELFTVSGSTGTVIAETITDAAGAYSFGGLDAGTYGLRVVSGTVTSARNPGATGMVPVPTFRTDATSGAPVDVTNEVGGGAPGTTSSATTNVAVGGTFSTSPGYAEAVAYVLVGGSNIGGVDFGYNFDTVTNPNDSGQGSLRQVLTHANTLGGGATLAVDGRAAGIEHVIFMVGNGSSAPGLRSSVNLFSGGVATITPTSALPAVSNPLVIDAQTQPGWTATPLIALRGESAGSSSHGLSLDAAGSTVRGLSVGGFAQAGIHVNAASVTIQGVYAGLAPDGTTVRPNNTSNASTGGIHVAAGSGVVIGGTTATTRNVLSGNSGAGLWASGGVATLYGNHIGTDAAGSAAKGNGNGGVVLFDGGPHRVGGAASGQGNVISGNAGATAGGVVLYGSGHVVQGNTIGLNAARTAALPNGNGSGPYAAGVDARGGSGHSIGGTASGEGNVISGNQGLGVRVTAQTTAILGNSIYGNSSLGIDLNADGVSVNDGAKTSGQPNLLMDTPVLTSARARGTQLTVAGHVGSAAGQATFAGARVELFVSDNDSSGYGEGRTLLGTLTADASGNFSGTLTMPVSALAVGTLLTGTATDGAGNSSEFGPNFTGLVVDFVVNTTADDADTTVGDGQCLTAAGLCSLRAAIAELNAWPTPATAPTITFDLPGCSSAGSAACRISVVTALPTMVRSMSIDATTQPGWNGSSFAPLVVLDGSTAVSTASGLTLGAGSHGVRGLVIQGFGQSGVLASAGSGHVIAGNWIGLDAAGTGAQANGSAGSATGGVYISAASGVRVGGSTAADRNVLSGNGGAGVWIQNGSGHTVQGNYIGTNAAGDAAVGNGRWGLVVYGDDNMLGGSGSGEGNVVSGNTGAGTGGVFIDGNRNLLRGNLVGLDAGGSTVLANGTLAGVDIRNGQDNQVGGLLSAQGNRIVGNSGAGVRLSATAGTGNSILRNSIHGHSGLGIDLGGDNVTPNDGSLAGGAPNNGMDHPVISAAGVADALDGVTVMGAIGTGSGQAVFAGARVEIYKADGSGYGEGLVYLGSLTADANGRFDGTLAITPGTLAVGDPITATATGSGGSSNGSTSEFGPNWTSTTMAALTPAGFNAFETDTPGTAITGVIRSKVAGAAAPLAVVALNSAGTALHSSFTGTVTLSWVDARDDSGAVSGSCRSSWPVLAAAGTATFAASARVTVNLTPPASGTRVMRLKMSHSSGATTVEACSSDAFAALPASLTLAASDASASTAGTSRTLDTTAASGGAVHQAGRPFTVTAQALDATGAAMTGYGGTPTLATAGCLLPAGCTAGALSSPAATATAGVYTNNNVSYAEVGAINLQLTDTDYGLVDAADTAEAQRTVQSAVVSVGRFVPDNLLLTVSGNGSFATANGACLLAGQGATFIGQGFGWATAPQVTVTARNAAGATTALWTGTLMKLTGAAQVPALAVASAGTATLSSSFGAITVTDLGGGQARLDASSADRFLLDLPAGTVQATVTPAWTWSLAVADASEAGFGGNPTLTASADQAGVPFDSGALFHSGRLALAGAHGDARAGVRSLVQLQRWTAAGWVTMTEDRGCVTVQPQHLGVESPSGVFNTLGDCAAPVAAAVTTLGGRAWLSLPATPGAAPGRLALRLAGAAATGHSCAALYTSAPLVPLAHPWLLGGATGPGPSAMATWGLPNRDVVLRRETW